MAARNHAAFFFMMQVSSWNGMDLDSGRRVCAEGWVSVGVADESVEIIFRRRFRKYTGQFESLSAFKANSRFKVTTPLIHSD
jgi:hypothetical protein